MDDRRTRRIAEQRGVLLAARPFSTAHSAASYSARPWASGVPGAVAHRDRVAAWNSPSIAVIPLASRLLPLAQRPARSRHRPSARPSAAAVRRARPCARRSLPRGRNSVPIAPVARRGPAARRCVPLTMARAMPARSAISAACSFEVIPPEPRPEAEPPLGHRVDFRGHAVDLAAAGSRRPRPGRGRKSPSTSDSSSTALACAACATRAARRSLSPKRISGGGDANRSR